jgi:hypothetical protein
MPTPTAPMPGQESSQVRSAWSARSYDWQLEGGEPEGCYEESAALVEHGLFDQLVRSHQYQWRNRQP